MDYDIESVKDWDSLCRVAHGMAYDKGWWEDGQRPVYKLRLLIVTELAEAVECLRDGKIETWYADNGKPEGFWVEIGDALIRLADAVGGQAMTCGEIGELGGPSKHRVELWSAIDVLLCHLHNHDNSRLVRLALIVAESHKHDLWATIRTKLAYNATRPHKHGRKA